MKLKIHDGKNNHGNIDNDKPEDIVITIPDNDNSQGMLLKSRAPDLVPKSMASPKN